MEKEVTFNQNQLKKVLELVKFARSEVNYYMNDRLKELQSELENQELEPLKLNFDEEGRVKLNGSVSCYCNEHVNSAHCILNSIVINLRRILGEEDSEKSHFEYFPEKLRKVYIDNPQLVDELFNLNKNFSIEGTWSFYNHFVEVAPKLDYYHALKKFLDRHDELHKKYNEVSHTEEGIRLSYDVEAAGNLVKSCVDLIISDVRIYAGIHRKKK